MAQRTGVAETSPASPRGTGPNAWSSNSLARRIPPCCLLERVALSTKPSLHAFGAEAEAVVKPVVEPTSERSMQRARPVDRLLSVVKEPEESRVVVVALKVENGVTKAA